MRLSDCLQDNQGESPVGIFSPIPQGLVWSYFPRDTASLDPSAPTQRQALTSLRQGRPLVSTATHSLPTIGGFKRTCPCRVDAVIQRNKLRNSFAPHSSQ